MSSNQRRGAYGISVGQTDSRFSGPERPITDMAGVHELYRFDAFFVLMFAAWAHRRFKPESPVSDIAEH